MISLLQGRFGYEHLHKYPHLTPQDIKIWDRFIDKYPFFFTLVDYDVCVGGCRECPHELNEPTEKNRQYLGKYKIDVVGYKQDKIFICEVKPQASGKALGQAIMYDYLYTRDFNPQVPTQAAIITDDALPDMAELCAEHNIALFVV